VLNGASAASGNCIAALGDATCGAGSGGTTGSGSTGGSGNCIAALGDATCGASNGGTSGSGGSGGGSTGSAGTSGGSSGGADTNGGGGSGQGGFIGGSPANNGSGSGAGPTAGLGAELAPPANGSTGLALLPPANSNSSTIFGGLALVGPLLANIAGTAPVLTSQGVGLVNDIAGVQAVASGGGVSGRVANPSDLKPASLGDGGLGDRSNSAGSYAWDVLELGSVFFLALLAAALRSRRNA
jgi:hypothetical protein